MNYFGLNNVSSNEINKIKAAIIIQKYVRGYFIRKYRLIFKLRKEKYNELNKKIIKLQKYAKGGYVRKKFLLFILISYILLKRKKAVYIIENAYILFQKKKKHFIKLLCQHILNVRNEAAILLQKYIKGNYTRKILEQNKKKFVIKWHYKEPKNLLLVVVKLVTLTNYSLKKYIMKYCFINNCYLVAINKIKGLYEYYFLLDDNYYIDTKLPFRLNNSGKYVNYQYV